MTRKCECCTWAAGTLLLLLTVSVPTCAGQSADQLRFPSKKQMELYTGCYQLTMGRWWPWSFGEDTQYVTPPSRVELTPDQGTKGFEKDHLLMRVAPTQKSMVSGGRGGSFWEMQPKNRIDLIWTDGFIRLTLKLERHGNDLRGWAHPHFDSPTLVPRIARVKGQRIACDAP
jgi:hypothetical protein